MKIYTSYFGVGKKLPKDFTQISIALYTPKGFKGITCGGLTPTLSILNNWKEHHDEEEYRKDFFEQILNKQNPHKFIEALNGAEIENPVLMCFEKSDEFCHRHLVAEWLRNAGYDCEEWKEEEQV